MNQTQNAQLHMLLTQTGLKNQKADLVSSYTDGRTEHSSEMDFREAGELIKYLQLYKKGEPQQPANSANEMRRKILSIAHERKWYLRDDKDNLRLRDGKPMLDFNRIDNWCIKYGMLHKPLQQHTRAELVSLVTQFKHLKKTSSNG